MHPFKPRGLARDAPESGAGFPRTSLRCSSQLRTVARGKVYSTSTLRSRPWQLNRWLRFGWVFVQANFLPRTFRENRGGTPPLKAKRRILFVVAQANSQVVLGLAARTWKPSITPQGRAGSAPQAGEAIPVRTARAASSSVEDAFMLRTIRPTAIPSFQSQPA